MVTGFFYKTQNRGKGSERMQTTKRHFYRGYFLGEVCVG